MKHSRWFPVCVTSVLLTLIACVPPEPPEVPRPLPPPMSDEEITPDEIMKLEIIDLNELPSADGSTVTVTGRVLNQGTRSTRQVYVHIEALDRDGAVIVRVEADPTTQVIPSGSAAPFTATLAADPSTDRYRVEAMGR